MIYIYIYIFIKLFSVSFFLSLFLTSVVGDRNGSSSTHSSVKYIPVVFKSDLVQLSSLRSITWAIVLPVKAFLAHLVLFKTSMSVFGPCQVVLDRAKYQGCFGVDKMSHGPFRQDQMSASPESLMRWLVNIIINNNHENEWVNDLLFPGVW